MINKTDFIRLLPTKLQSVNSEVVANKIFGKIAKTNKDIQSLNIDLNHDDFTLDEMRYIVASIIMSRLVHIVDMWSITILQVDVNSMTIVADFTNCDNSLQLKALHQDFNVTVLDDTYLISLKLDTSNAIQTDFEHCGTNAWFWSKSQNQYGWNVFLLPTNCVYGQKMLYVEQHGRKYMIEDFYLVLRNWSFMFVSSLQGDSAKTISFNYAKTVAKYLGYTWLREHTIKRCKPVFKYAHKV